MEATRRELEADEKAREHNDPSRPDTQTSYWLKGRALSWLKFLALAVPLIGILTVAGFIAYNILAN